MDKINKKQMFHTPGLPPLQPSCLSFSRGGKAGKRSSSPSVSPSRDDHAQKIIDGLNKKNQE